MTPIRILAIAGDPGGANALAPVLEELAKDERVYLTTHAYGQTMTLWQGRGFPAPSPALAAGATLDALLADYALLLCATSATAEMAELRYIAVAQAAGVATLSLLDYWANYALRFRANPDAPLCLPQSIAVMDDAAVAEMVAEGFPKDTLVVTGQPALDRFAQRSTVNHRQALRRELGVKEDELLLIFASQPLAELYDKIHGDPCWLGYHQYGVVQALCDVLDAIAERHGQALTLVILPHPRETPASYEQIHAQRITLRTESGDPHRWAGAADLVCGMNSMFLVESCHAGNLTVSLQPGLCRPDTLPVSRQGICPLVLREAEMATTVESLLYDAQVRDGWLKKLINLPNDGGAARRVAQLALRMAGVE